MIFCTFAFVESSPKRETGILIGETQGEPGILIGGTGPQKITFL